MPHPELEPREPMNTNYSITPAGVGKAPSSAPNNLKYVFDLAKSVLFDVEVYPPGRWCCGFLSYDGKHTCVDGDRVQLTAILDKIHRAGRTLVGYNSRDYDIPILRAVLAGADVFQVSHALINYEGWGLPPELRDRAAHWPRIPADHIDLAARTRMNRAHSRAQDDRRQPRREAPPRVALPTRSGTDRRGMGRGPEVQSQGSRGDPAPARPLRPGTPSDRGPLAALRHGLAIRTSGRDCEPDFVQRLPGSARPGSLSGRAPSAASAINHPARCGGPRTPSQRRGMTGSRPNPSR